MTAVAEVVMGPVAQATGWALVHFVWQGALLALVLAGLLHAPGLRSPRVRYGLCFLGLLAMVTLPLATGWVVYTPAPAAPVETPAETAATKAPPAAPEPGNSPAGGTSHAGPAPSLSISPAATPAREFTPAAPPRHEVIAAMLRWERIREALAPYVPGCVLVWLLGVFVMGWRNLASWVLVQRLRTHGVEPVPDRVEALVAALGARLGVRRAVACLQSSRIAVPATIGWLKPVVLLPASSLLGLEASQLEAILAHELAHIRRHDYLANLFQTLAETVLFYHPAVWWVSRRMRLERELCCDDVAVQLCASPAVYAGALARVAALQQAPAHAMAASGGSLLARIRRLARRDAVRPSRLPNALLSLAVVVGASAALVGPNLPKLFAQESDEPPGARTLNFPEWTMGQVMVRPWGSDLDGEWQAHQPAMGAVNVPEGMEAQLVVDNNAVTDLSPLAYMGTEDLQSINFRRTEVQDEQLAHIEGMQLRDLDFELTENTNEAIQYFDDMTSLERLSVGRTNVNNEGVGQLGGLTGLRYLDLNLTGVNDEGFAQLENLRELDYLDLWNAEISDESLRLIGALQNLRTLGLEETSITDEGLGHLRNLVNLEDLNLQTTPVSDEGVRQLAALRNLKKLNIRNTRVTEAIVDFLVASFDLQRFNLPRYISPDALSRMEGSGYGYPPGTPRLLMQVRESGTLKPIPNANIELNWRAPNYTPHFFWTDETGNAHYYANYNLPADVTVRAEGYVPVTEEWTVSESKEVTIILKRAEAIGGYVVDETGARVGAVTVSFAIPGKHDYRMDNIAPHAESTDEDGVFACEHAPGDLSEFWIELRHPDYVPTKYTAGELPVGGLKAGSARLVIRKGIEVSGTVKDEQGEPVPGATVVELETRRRGLVSATQNSAQTDGEGVFHLTNQRVGDIRLKVNAGGYLPLVEDVVFAADGPPLEFTLTVGMLLQGKVVDPADKPIEGVRVEIPQNIGRGTTDHLNTYWKTVTDSDGRFLWDEAPEEAVSLRFTKPGYQMVEKSLVASDEDIVVVMGPPLIVSGAILDADTGETVARPVQVELLGLRDTSSGLSGISTGSRALDDQDGQYEVSFKNRFGGFEADAFQFKILASGYMPYESPRFDPDEGNVTHDITLQPVTPVNGIVLDADENPVAGAKVYAFDAEEDVGLQNNRPRRHGPHGETEPAETDESGRFSVLPPAESCTFVATADAGYAVLRDQPVDGDPPTLILVPWGRIELRAMRGDEPESGATVILDFVYKNHGDDGATPLYWNYNDGLGEDGRGTFARVVPGDYRLLKGGHSHTGTSVSRPVEVAAGDTTTAQVGGTGRPVAASVDVPKDVADESHWEDGMMVELHTRMPDPPTPDGFEEWTELEQDIWRGLWRESEEGKAFQASLPPAVTYYTGFTEDHSFRLEGVAPGDYNLVIQFRGERTQENQWNPDVLGTIKREVTVEGVEGDHPRPPQELGVLTLDEGGEG